MKERPIIFDGESVRAILAGTKTQARRVVKSPAKNMQRMGSQVIKHREPGDAWYGDHVWSMRGRMGVWGDYTHDRFMQFCPYGAPGDLLWVREAWGHAHDGALLYRADHDGECNITPGDKWRSPTHMRHVDSRITLRVTDVRVERVQDISEEWVWAVTFEVAS